MLFPENLVVFNVFCVNINAEVHVIEDAFLATTKIYAHQRA